MNGATLVKITQHINVGSYFSSDGFNGSS